MFSNITSPFTTVIALCARLTRCRSSSPGFFGTREVEFASLLRDGFYFRAAVRTLRSPDPRRRAGRGLAAPPGRLPDRRRRRREADAADQGHARGTAASYK